MNAWKLGSTPKWHWNQPTTLTLYFGSSLNVRFVKCIIHVSSLYSRLIPLYEQNLAFDHYSLTLGYLNSLHHSWIHEPREKLQQNHSHHYDSRRQKEILSWTRARLRFEDKRYFCVETSCYCRVLTRRILSWRLKV